MGYRFLLGVGVLGVTGLISGLRHRRFARTAVQEHL